MNNFMAVVVVVAIGLLALLPILRQQGRDSSSRSAKRLSLLISLIIAAAILAAYVFFTPSD